MNLHKFYMGEAFDAYEYFGAHPDVYWVRKRFFCDFFQ